MQKKDWVKLISVSYADSDEKHNMRSLTQLDEYILHVGVVLGAGLQVQSADLFGI